MDRPAPTDSPPRLLAACLLPLAVLFLSLSLQVREGLYHPRALILLTLAILLTAAALFLARRLSIPHTLLPLFLFSAILLQCLILWRSYPGAAMTTWDAPASRSELARLKNDLLYHLGPDERRGITARTDEIESTLRPPYYRAAAAGLALLAIAALLAAHRRSRLTVPLLGATLVLFVAIGVMVLRANPRPYIDVFVFQRDSCQAVLDGQNPYAQRFTNIYGEDAKVYGKGLSTSHEVKFGYPYPPLALYFALPGHVLAGDHRVSHLVTLALAAALLALARPDALLLPIAAALLLVTSPRVFMLAELSWTEPGVVFTLALTVFCAVRFPSMTPYALGLFLASKQYLVFALPLSLLLLSRPWTFRSVSVFFAKVLGVALVISLPMIFSHPREFIHSAVTLQLQQPFRADSLAYPAPLWWKGHEILAQRLSYAAYPAALVAAAISLRWCARNAFGFSLALAFTYLVFFSLSKQAFCNYYFFPLAALCCALATINFPASTPAPEPAAAPRL